MSLPLYMLFGKATYDRRTGSESYESLQQFKAKVSSGSIQLKSVGPEDADAAGGFLHISENSFGLHAKLINYDGIAIYDSDRPY